MGDGLKTRQSNVIDVDMEIIDVNQGKPKTTTSKTMPVKKMKKAEPKKYNIVPTDLPGESKYECKICLKQF